MASGEAGRGVGAKRRKFVRQGIVKATLRLAIGSVIALTAQVPAHAQDQPTVFSAYGQNLSENATKCGVSFEPSIRQVEQALQQERQTVVAYANGTRARNAILIYVGINALPVMSGEKAAVTCAVSVKVQFHSFAAFTNPTNGAPHFGTLLYCDKDALLIRDAVTSQDSVSRYLRDIIPQCLESYEASKD